MILGTLEGFLRFVDSQDPKVTTTKAGRVSHSCPSAAVVVRTRTVVRSGHTYAPPISFVRTCICRLEMYRPWSRITRRRPKNWSRRSFLKLGAGAVAGAAVAASVGIPSASGTKNDSHVNTLQAQLTSTTSQVTSLSSQLSTTTQSLQSSQSTATNLQTELSTLVGFLYLNETERPLLESVLEAIIPSDSNGPGAKEAGVIYFIDRQLASDYGTSGNDVHARAVRFERDKGTDHRRRDAPIRRARRTTAWRRATATSTAWTSVTSGGGAWTPSRHMRTAHTGATLRLSSATNKAQLLTDLWNNIPKSFNSILPLGLCVRALLHGMVRLPDGPAVRRQQNMVGWTYTGFNGVNMGDFYGEGLTSKQLMVATTPTRLKPASLAQLQTGASGGSSSSSSTSASASSSSSSSSSSSGSA